MPASSLFPATRASMERVLRCEPPAGAPPFLPAIYEYKAALIGATPTAIAKDHNLLARALLAEYEMIGADALTVGVDVYNIEAEAVGAKIIYPSAGDPGVPGLDIGHHPFSISDDFDNAPIPHPLRDGRMPVFVNAAKMVRRELGDRIWLRGALSGPFSLAVSLVGLEDLFIACLEDPTSVHRVLNYCSRIVQSYAGGFIDAGAEIVIFDSQATPDLLSPALYEQFVLPVTADLLTWAAASGVRDVPLIIGGNTTSIAEHLIATGANNLLCDFAGDFERWSAACSTARRSLRRNISPRFLASATPDQAYEAARTELARGRDLPGFIMGTGVIPIGTPLEVLSAIRRACRD